VFGDKYNDKRDVKKGFQFFLEGENFYGKKNFKGKIVNRR